MTTHLMIPTLYISSHFSTGWQSLFRVHKRYTHNEVVPHLHLFRNILQLWGEFFVITIHSVIIYLLVNYLSGAAHSSWTKEVTVTATTPRERTNRPIELFRIEADTRFPLDKESKWIWAIDIQTLILIRIHLCRVKANRNKTSISS